MLSWLTSLVEGFFPLVWPVIGPRNNTDWQEPAVYYFTDDSSPRLRQRWGAILRLNGREVSFWRRRVAYLRNPLRGWDYV